MSIFEAAPLPKSQLGYHRILSSTAGARVSPLCLGGMSLGDAWKSFMGECSKETVFEILDYFFGHGGNFVDTSNNYQNEQSEKWIGEWMEERGIRDQIFVATKFTTWHPSHEVEPPKIRSNFAGNHAKSLRISVEGSLGKLRTKYIDLLYVHWWDFTTSIPELMNALHRLVLVGKVLYLGISDTPAWVVSKANQYARDHALTPFSVYQGQWNAACRDVERDILPMCQDEGMALVPWRVLGGGRFKTADQLAAPSEGRKQPGPQSETEKLVSAALEKVAERKGTTSLTSIALAYVMHKSTYVFPIVGCRTLEHLQANIGALSIELSDEEVDEIDNAAPFEIGFPMNMLFEFGGLRPGLKYSTRMTAADVAIAKPAVHLRAVEKPRPIPPVKIPKEESKEESKAES